MNAAEVKALQVGEMVWIQKEGSKPILCTIAYSESPANKFLTCRIKGQIKRFSILDYPGVHYCR